MQFLQEMKPAERYHIVMAPAGFEDYPKRRPRYCKSRNEANELRARIKRWKAEKKAPSETLSFDDYHKRWLAYLQAHVGNLELLPEIVAHWERTAKAITQPLTVAALAKAFVLYRQTKKLGKGTLSEDRYVARRLVKVLGNRMAHEIGAKEIRTFLDSASGEQIERKLYKVASLIFDHAKEQRVVVLNPFSEIDRPELSHAIPGILTPAQFKMQLLRAESIVPDILPYLVLVGFNAVRREELVKEYAEDEVLQWSDINWDKRLITIRDEVAKQTRRRVGNRRFIPMEPVLIDWLEPYRKDSGPIIPVTDSAFRRRTDKLKEATKFDPPRNALRHSYCSYWLARSTKEGLGEVAKRMGNSESTCRRHYLETLTSEEGRDWFALRRSEAP